MAYSNPEDRKAYFRNYYRERRQELVTLLGGKCVRCGTKKNLEFDHIERTSKKFSIGKLMRYSKAKLMEEIKLCQLLCRKCHTDKTIPENGHVRMKTHGTTGMYRRGCRCAVCKKGYSIYQMKYRLTWRVGRAAKGTRLESEQG